MVMWPWTSLLSFLDFAFHILKGSWLSCIICTGPPRCIILCLLTAFLVVITMSCSANWCAWHLGYQRTLPRHTAKFWPMATGLTSLGRQNKFPQMWWFKTAGLYSLTVPEAVCLKSRCQQGRVLSEGCMEGFFQAVSKSLLLLGLWLHHSSLWLRGHMAFSLRVCPQLCFLFLHRQHWSRAHPNLAWLICNFAVPPAKTPCK